MLGTERRWRMNNKTASWQERFGLKICAATEIDPAIPASIWGVAVFYAAQPEGETIYMVLESRANSLREICTKRLLTAKIPAGTVLSVAFKGTSFTTPSPEAVSAACREQVIFASELRRELRPAMR